MDFERGSCQGCHGFPCLEEHAPEAGFSKAKGRKMEDWDFLHHCGEEGQGNGILLFSLLSPPSVIRPNLSVLPLQIPEGSQLLGWARDAAFPGSRILGGQEWASRGLQVPRAGGSSWSISQGGRVVEKSLGEEKGRERRKRRVERKVRVALPSSQPRAKQWSGPASQKAGQSPREHRSPLTFSGSFPSSGFVPVAGSGTRHNSFPAGAPCLPRASKANHWCLMKKHLLNRRQQDGAQLGQAMGGGQQCFPPSAPHRSQRSARCLHLQWGWISFFFIIYIYGKPDFHPL